MIQAPLWPNCHAALKKDFNIEWLYCNLGIGFTMARIFGFQAGGYQMRNLLVGLVAATALVGVGATAMAADMPLKAPAYVPPPVVSWTGFYIGGNVGGYGASQTATTDPFPSPGFGAPAILGGGVPGFGNLPTSRGLDSSGVLGGIQAEQQLAVIELAGGVEGDVDFLKSPRQQQSDQFSKLLPPLRLRHSTCWFRPIITIWRLYGDALAG